MLWENAPSFYIALLVSGVPAVSLLSTQFWMVSAARLGNDARAWHPPEAHGMITKFQRVVAEETLAIGQHTQVAAAQARRTAHPQATKWLRWTSMRPPLVVVHRLSQV